MINPAPFINTLTWQTTCPDWVLLNFWPIRQNNWTIVDSSTIRLWTWYLNQNIDVDDIISWNILAYWSLFTLVSNIWNTWSICLDFPSTSWNVIALDFDPKWNSWCDIPNVPIPGWSTITPWSAPIPGPTPSITTNPWFSIDIITNPWQSSQSFESNNVIVWNWVRIFSDIDTIVFKSNTGWLTLSRVSMVNQSNTLSGATITKEFSPAKVLANWESVVLFSWYNLRNFIWDTSDFSSLEFYRNVNPDEFYLKVEHFDKISMPVRVSRAAISNIWWWSAYLFRPAWYDLSSINNNFIDNLKNWNFVLSAVNKTSKEEQQLGWLYETSDSNIVNSISGSIYAQAKIFSNSSLSDFNPEISINNSNEFETLRNLGQKSNVKTVNGLTINSSLSLSWKKTIIL
ncbi:MAG: hypothetical protein ACD_4C00059G0001, partial [uncultured bacterium (gcode 4)]